MTNLLARLSHGFPPIRGQVYDSYVVAGFRGCCRTDAGRNLRDGDFSQKVARGACIRGITSPSGRGRRAAAGEGLRSMQILRPSPCPLPEGEGKSPSTSISFTP